MPKTARSYTVNVAGNENTKDGTAAPDLLYTGLTYAAASVVTGFTVHTIPTPDGQKATTVTVPAPGANEETAVSITFTLSSSALPNLKFKGVSWLSTPVVGVGNSPAPVVGSPTNSGLSITITDTDITAGNYNFQLEFKNATGITQGKSQDPTIYNAGTGS